MDPFDAVYARMLFVSRRRTQAELAELLNLQQGSISEAKKRGGIPLSWCVRISDLFHVRMEWLRFGEPPMFMNSDQSGYEGGESAVTGFRQPPQIPLAQGCPGELPVYGTIPADDGKFPEVERQIFPLDFLREGVEIFRVLEKLMAPALNAGALVAVVRKSAVTDGDLVAVWADKELQFRRVFRTLEGYELCTECRDTASVRLVSEADWPSVYYGKALWAFQPL